MLTTIARLLRRSRCIVCGNALQVTRRQAICDELANDWGLSAGQRAYFDEREGCCCVECGAPLRSRDMAAAILSHLHRRHGIRALSLRELGRAEAVAALRVAEINSCGTLHPFLLAFPGLAYSEYGSLEPGIPSEDLLALSYENESFDLVLHSDVLEHVPDYRRALVELGRVLKPGGTLIFTAPVLPDRNTRTRARITDTGVCEPLLPNSYHGRYQDQKPDHLVFHEFGRDFFDEITAHFNCDPAPAPWQGCDYPTVFTCTKRGS